MGLSQRRKALITLVTLDLLPASSVVSLTVAAFFPSGSAKSLVDKEEGPFG